MEVVTVSLDPEGVPVAVVVGGKLWRVVHEPVRWFERTAWWERGRPPRGRTRVDVEVWRLRCLPQEAAAGAEPTTFELVRAGEGTWSSRPLGSG